MLTACRPRCTHTAHEIRESRSCPGNRTSVDRAPLLPLGCVTFCGLPLAMAPGQGLLVVMACVKTAESMEAFKARPFHLMGKTKDEVAGLKRDYERSPHGRKYQGDMGVVDAASLPLERDGGCHRQNTGSMRSYPACCASSGTV